MEDELKRGSMKVNEQLDGEYFITHNFSYTTVTAFWDSSLITHHSSLVGLPPVGRVGIRSPWTPATPTPRPIRSSI
jgi:hypothetical protein